MFGEFDDRDICSCSIGYKCSECQTQTNRSKFTGSISFGSGSIRAPVDPNDTFFDQPTPSSQILDDRTKKKIAARKAKSLNISKRQARRERERTEKRIANAELFIKSCMSREEHKEEEGFGPLYFLIKFCFGARGTIRPIMETFDDLLMISRDAKLEEIVRLEDLQEAWNRMVVKDTINE